MREAALKPDQTTLMIKPVGPACNLACSYCYYLPVHGLFDGRVHRMETETLERVFADALPRFAQAATIAWQGGEPTLAGLDFFRTAVRMQRRHGRPGQRIDNGLQTNGTQLTDDWCRFLRDEGFLVGLSLDGPHRFHDHYRRDRRGATSSAAVHEALERLEKHGVEYNVLCVVNDRNVHYPDELLGFFVNRGLRWLQFVPAVEWEHGPAAARPEPMGHTPSGEAYGRFLCRVFDRWFERHRNHVSIRLFDAVLQRLVAGGMPFCILAESCHNQLTVEHDGSVFGCDHYVEPHWRLGHADGPGWFDRLDTERLGAFAARKHHLPEQCEACAYRSLCHGGCPKHRPHRGELAEPSHLCAGYRMFYAHALARLEWLAGFLKQGRQPPSPHAAAHGADGADGCGRIPGKNAPCLCGSGKKFKQCCRPRFSEQMRAC